MFTRPGKSSKDKAFHASSAHNTIEQVTSLRYLTLRATASLGTAVVTERLALGCALEHAMSELSFPIQLFVYLPEIVWNATALLTRMGTECQTACSLRNSVGTKIKQNIY